MSPPAISVVIPTFNRGQQLLTAVTTVLRQTHTNFELIVVDDASKKPVAESLKDIRDDRLCIIRHEENQGVSGARNTGAKAARAPLLAFLDDDDLWHPQKLERQVVRMNAGRHAAVLTDFAAAGKDSLYRRTNSKRDPDWLIATGSAMLMGSSMLVRREVFHEVGNFNPSMRRAQDWDWMLRLHKAGHKVEILPETLTVYSGAHRSNPGVERQSVNAIQFLHGPDFSGKDPFSRAFQAAVQWKTARIDLEQQKIMAAAARLAVTTIQHPVHFGRYVRSIMSAPIRGLFSPQAKGPDLQS